MFTSKLTTPKKIVTPDGFVMRLSWVDTLLNMKVGEERCFDREILTVSSARTLASSVNTRFEGVRFTCSSVGNDDAVIIRRER